MNFQVPEEFKDVFEMDDLVNQVFSALMLAHGDTVYIKDRHNRIVFMNEKGLQDLGFETNDEIAGKTDGDLYGEQFGGQIHAMEAELFRTGAPIVNVIEFTQDLAGEGQIWTSSTKIPLKNAQGEIIGLLGFTRMINELKFREERLRFQATHDALTNVFNRTGLVEVMQDKVKKRSTNIALLAIDLDNFKHINDAFGHMEGDKYLRWAAWLFKATVRGNDVVARVGGDEYIVLLDGMDDPRNASIVCEKIINNFNRTLDEKYKNLELGLSIGVSNFPQDTVNPLELMRMADDALYWVKYQGKHGFAYYDDIQ